MAEQQAQSNKKSNPMLLVIGIVLIGLGATVMSNINVPVPGLALNLGHTAAMVGMMLVLFPVVKSFYTDPLEQAIQERNSGLEQTFAEAESLRSDMAQLRSDYERRLVETESAARDQIQSEIRKAQELRSQMEVEARQRADEFLRKAQEEIDIEKNRVMNDLRLHVVDLTLGATEKILGENVDSDRNRKLIAEFIDKVEVPG